MKPVIMKKEKKFFLHYEIECTGIGKNEREEGKIKQAKTLTIIDTYNACKT